MTISLFFGRPCVIDEQAGRAICAYHPDWRNQPQRQYIPVSVDGSTRMISSSGRIETFHLTEGSSVFVASITAPVASGLSGCRMGLAPTGKRRLFHGEHPIQTLRAFRKRPLEW
jgi:hypothetical protein